MFWKVSLIHNILWVDVRYCAAIDARYVKHARCYSNSEPVCVFFKVFSTLMLRLCICFYNAQRRQKSETEENQRWWFHREEENNWTCYLLTSWSIMIDVIGRVEWIETQEQQLRLICTVKMPFEIDAFGSFHPFCERVSEWNTLVFTFEIVVNISSSFPLFWSYHVHFICLFVLFYKR